MKLLDTINKIESYSICEDNSIIFKNKNIDNFLLFYNKELIFTSLTDFSFNELIRDEIIFITDRDGKNYLINFKGIVIGNDLNISLEANYALFKDLKISVIIKGEIYSGEYNLEKKAECEFFFNLKKKWEIKYIGCLHFYSKKIVLKFPNPINGNPITNQFSRLSFETGERLWDFDLDEHLDKLVSAYPYEGAWLVPDHHPQIKEPIGVYKDQLWFSMKHYGLLCLNYHTGAFMHYLRDCPENDKGWPYMLNGKFSLIPFTENAIIIENEGKMICFDSVMYWELNLETLQMDFHFLEDYLKNEVQCYTTNTRFKKLIVENEKIYMVDNLHRKFGCFNRRTLKYDWIEPLPEGSGAPRSIEKHGNRLYIDTSKKELLVYELEENEIENNL